MTDRQRGCEAPVGAGPHLARRERDILAASARGLPVPEVAGELGLAVADVRAALASAIRKLGARSKLEAIVIAIRRGDIVLERDGAPRAAGPPSVDTPG